MSGYNDNSQTGGSQDPGYYNDDGYSAIDRWMGQSYHEDPWNPLSPRDPGSNTAGSKDKAGKGKGKGAKGSKGKSGIPYAYFKTNWELNYRESTKHLGPICMDEQEMGRFVAKGPLKKWSFFQIHNFPRTQPPNLLAVAGLIKAGDEGAYTSKIFSKIPQNHCNVSWKPFYDAVYTEYASWLRNAGVPFPEAEGDIDLAMFLEKDSKNVQKLKASQREMAQRTANFIKGRNPAIANVLVEEKRTASPEGPKLDKTLKTYQFKDVDTPSKLPPTWWKEHLSKIWIHEGHPAIEVFKEDLATLSLIMGIPLHATGHEFLPDGRGAFGITLASDKVSRLTTFSLTYSHRQGTTAMGSGYSTLFAKHVACGCLPFVQVVDEEGKRITHTIDITDEVARDLKHGWAINSQAPARPTPRSEKYLWRLPSLTGIDLYSNCVQISGSTQGEIFNTGEDGDRHIGYWWQAVAGLAFGGLVPFATKNIKDIVEFTLAGELECPRVSDLAHLQALVRLVKKEIPSERNLFGSLSSSGPGSVTVQDVEDRDTRILVETLNRYTTLLERLMAITAEKFHQSDKDVLEKVYRCVETTLENSYNKAVARHRDEASRPPGCCAFEKWVEGEDLLRIVQDMSSLHDMDAEIGIYICGKMAVYLIAAWARLAKTVDWSGRGRTLEKVDGNSETETHEIGERDEAKSYCPPLLRELPDISAWY
ncbi:hypothetical protein OQA88_4793 [Cercophora sp. LCS_1]